MATAGYTRPQNYVSFMNFLVNDESLVFSHLFEMMMMKHWIFKLNRKKT